MKVLVVGSGGREHALCWAIAKSPACEKLFCAPGNAGIAAVANCAAIDVDDFEGLVAFATDHSIDLVVVGPEAPLVDGLVDRLETAGISAFGPDSRGAILEASKGFMKDFFAKYGIPTAKYARFTDRDTAVKYIRAEGAPIVVKADGLAAGKGVSVCATEAEAIKAVDDAMSERVFGDAGAEVVIEEFLAGEEASYFALVDGKTALPLVAAQDHKQAFDGDRGPNTGGMGAYSPAPVVTPEMAMRIMSEIVQPTIEGMAAEGRPYRGVLFAGVMIVGDDPKVLEFNVRFGDPECQVLMARLKSDILEAVAAAADGRLAEVTLDWRDEAAVTVVMATRGYPGKYENGSEINGLTAAGELEDVTIFHAGTTANGEQVKANGGRVLGITALGVDVAAAQKRAYLAVDAIDWPEGFCRRDIGWRAMSRTGAQ